MSLGGFKGPELVQDAYALRSFSSRPVLVHVLLRDLSHLVSTAYKLIFHNRIAPSGCPGEISTRCS